MIVPNSMLPSWNSKSDDIMIASFQLTLSIKGLNFLVSVIVCNAMYVCSDSSIHLYTSNSFCSNKEEYYTILTDYFSAIIIALLLYNMTIT